MIVFVVLHIGFVRVLVFVVTKTKTPKFAVKFDLKLGGKNRKEVNLTDWTYFGYILTS